MQSHLRKYSCHGNPRIYRMGRSFHTRLSIIHCQISPNTVSHVAFYAIFESTKKPGVTTSFGIIKNSNRRPLHQFTTLPRANTVPLVCYRRDDYLINYSTKEYPLLLPCLTVFPFARDITEGGFARSKHTLRHFH